MRRIIILCSLLAAVNYGQATQEKNKTGNLADAMEYAATKATEIRTTEQTSYLLCSELRQHDLLYERKQLFKEFGRLCVEDGETNNCTYHADLELYNNVFDSIEPTICMKDMCSFWNSKIQKVEQSSEKCLLSQFWNILIDVWSRCSFMKPVVEASNSMSSFTAGYWKSMCIGKLEEKKVAAIETAWRTFGICKQRMPKIEDNQDGCVHLEKAQLAINNLTACYKNHVNFFENTFANLNNEIQECANQNTLTF